MNKAVFLDKDGTLIHDIPYNVKPELITFTDTAIPALKKLQDNGYLLIVISNQSGVARGYFTEEDLQPVSDFLKTVLGKEGINLSGFYYCPHHTDGKIEKYTRECDCRKPKPGLLLRAIQDFKIDASQSWMVGDILNDVEAGKAAGCRAVLIDGGNETEWILNDKRRPDYTVHSLLEAADIILQHA